MRQLWGGTYVWRSRFGVSYLVTPSHSWRLDAPGIALARGYDGHAHAA